MNRWDELITGPRAPELRRLLCQAARTAHIENAERYAPDDLGDNLLIYGITTSNSARWLVAHAVEDSNLDGVAVRDRGLVWSLEVDRGELPPVHVYLYKAPPGARSVWDLRFDTDIKKHLSASNGRQMELFTLNGTPGHADLLNVVVVHYGDPVTGPGHLDVGAPYLDRVKDDIVWEWDERFDLDEPGQQSASKNVAPENDGGFEGLKLIEPVGDDVAENRPAAPSAAGAGASAFEELDLRRPGEEDDHAGESDGASQ